MTTAEKCLLKAHKLIIVSIWKVLGCLSFVYADCLESLNFSHRNPEIRFPKGVCICSIVYTMRLYVHVCVHAVV